MRLLFVFVFLLGLVSCGEKKSSSSSSSDSSSNGESISVEPEKQPNCNEIDGELHQPETGIYKHCANGKVIWYKTYKDRKKIEEKMWFKRTGHLKYEKFYDENGGLTGLSRGWYEDGTFAWDIKIDGKAIIKRYYHKNGQLYIEQDEKYGLIKQWDENGNQTYP